MSKVRVGVIGVGRLGSLHARVYAELENVELQGVCDIDAPKAQTLAAQYKTRVYTNYLELLEQVDAISIAVPTQNHFQIARDCIDRGIHVLIEKPITNNLSEARELIELAKKRHTTIQVGHVERFNSAFTAAQKIVKNPRFIECHRLSPFPHRSLDIGVVFDVMIHDIDIILGLIKSEVTRVEAVGVPVLTPFEDIANVRVTFKNGCVCNLTASRISEEALRKIRIFLPDAYISLDYGSQEACVYRKEANTITKEPLPIEKEEPLKREIESFIDCLKHNKRPLVSGEEAYEALFLADEILKKIWNRKKIFVVAGEVSGDMHAAALMREMKKRNRFLQFKGLGGKHMEAAGVHLFFDLTKIAVIGLTEAIIQYVEFRRIFKKFLEHVDREKPDAVILVDFPFFNLKLATQIKEKGIKVIYYISPQIWAWAPKRINSIKKNVDKMIVFFDFEKNLYQKEAVNVDFVGHPLLDRACTLKDKQAFLREKHIEDKHPIISLLPGSRTNEIKKILPIMMQAAQHIYTHFPRAQFLILQTSNVDPKIYADITRHYSIPLYATEKDHCDVISHADLALVASGTATLEAAILNTPMIIVYKVSALTFAFYECVIKIPYIGLVNVVAGKKLVPEFLQYNAKPHLIAQEAIAILNDPKRIKHYKREFRTVTQRLGSPGATQRAAESSGSFINETD